MLVDVQTPFDPMNDFLNLDLFPSSSSSSSSPSTPPLFSPDPSFFNFNLDDDFAKLDPLTTSPSMAPYNFLSLADAYSTRSIDGGSSNSPDSLLSTASPPAMFAIDPQLVGTPATSKAFSDFDEDEEFAGDEGDEDLDRIGAPVTPVKAAGHGKLRKGTVQGGGVVKKSSAYSNAKDKENSGNTRDATIDDGKPPDYQKLSSKEKRQLRNKISARNFRVRRKGRCCHRFPYYLFL